MYFCACFYVVFLDSKQIYIYFFSFVISCSPFQLYKESYTGKAEIMNFSTSLHLDISQVGAVIFHILQVMWRRKIVKIVNLGERN